MPFEDFDRTHGLGVGGWPALPLGWAQVVAGGAAITFPQDARSGVCELTTGAAANSDACLYLDTDLVVINVEGWFQTAIQSISDITNLRVRVGLAPRAMWAGMGAAAALPGAWADYFLFDYDSGVSANWRLRYRTGTGAEQIGDTGVAAVVAANPLLAAVDPASAPYAYAIGRPWLINVATGVGAVLMAPGIYVETLTASTKEVVLDLLGWGCNRI